MSEKRIVWKLELMLDHEPGILRAVYSTKELAKAAAPSVKEWKPDGADGEYEVAPPFADMWTVEPILLDPEWDDLPHAASLLCETGRHRECEHCRCGCHPYRGTP